jgi:pyridoxine 4-dehydrogenase
MNAKLDAPKSGSFKIGGDIEIYRLGFGAMRLTGPVSGVRPPTEQRRCEPLRGSPSWESILSTPPIPMGPMFPNSSSTRHFILMILIATKAGLRRPRPGQWEPDGRPEYLRDQAIKSCKKLGLEQIGLWQLHRIDPKVPREKQFAAVKSLQDEGIIRTLA